MIDKNKFIQDIANASIELFPKYGIPVSVAIAQSSLESAFGKYDMGAFNIFGIKGVGPKGSVIKTTHEFDKSKKQYVKIQAKFRAYNSYKECLEDYMRILTTVKAYKKARESINNPIKFAHSLTGVYATDPNYGDKLERIIKVFDLTKYDIVKKI